jgi:hypothetical protein
MTVRFVRPVSTAAYVARHVALSALVLLVIALAVHRFGPLGTPSFVALVLLSAAILAVVAVGAYYYHVLPRLYDVSTDIANPPAWVHEPSADQMWMKRPIFVSPTDRQAQLSAYPGLTGRRYEGALDRVYEAVLKVGPVARISFGDDRSAKSRKLPAAKSPPKAQPADAAVPDVIPIPLPRPDAMQASRVLKADGGDLMLQGESRTLVLGLRFDIIVRLREEAETTLVDVRVASRYGPHDLGMSAEIAENFLRALDAELLGIAGG